MALKTILCVEEGRDLTDMLGMEFSEQGYNVYQMQTAEEALEFCLATTPDIIVSDVYLKGMDGLSFLKVVRGIGRLHRVPFVVVSVENDPSFIGIAKEFGASAYFWKPFDAEELVDVVSGILKPLTNRSRAAARWPLAEHPRVANRDTLTRV